MQQCKLNITKTFNQIQDVKRIAWHPSEDILASASYDNNVKMYREDDDEWISTCTLSSHTNTVWSLAWEHTVSIMDIQYCKQNLFV